MVSATEFVNFRFFYLVVGNKAKFRKAVDLWVGIKKIVYLNSELIGMMQ